VFGKHLGKWLIVYLDDVLIFSKTARKRDYTRSALHEAYAGGGRSHH
jgi:hypothetical protein